MLFGQFCYLCVYAGYWWSVLRRKVLLCSLQCSASLFIGKGFLWDSEDRKRFPSPDLPSFRARLTFSSTCHSDLYQIRWFDESDLRHWWRWRGQSSKCGGTSRNKLQKTIVRVSLSTACTCLLRRQVLINLAPKRRPYGSMFNRITDLHRETGNHQDQVKVLIEKTASSLDDAALKLLFVSVQQNNVDLCVQYAINVYVMFSYCLWHLTMTFFSLTSMIGVYSTVCCYHHNPSDCKAEVDLEGFDIVYTDMVWSFICECILNSTELGIYYGIVTSECQRKICKYLSSWKSSSIKIYFKSMSADAEKKKDYVIPIIILTCTIWD